MAGIQAQPPSSGYRQAETIPLINASGADRPADSRGIRAARLPQSAPPDAGCRKKLQSAG